MRNGEPLMIKCLASGFPTRSIKWKRLGKTIGDQALYFNSFKRSVGGVYLCEAYDQAGKDSKEIIVRVNDSPELEFPTKQKGKFHILFANLLGGLMLMSLSPFIFISPFLIKPTQFPHLFSPTTHYILSLSYFPASRAPTRSSEDIRSVWIICLVSIAIL